MSTGAAERAAALARQVRDALGPDDAPDRVVAFWVPGRIEFVGKHTDYAGGRSLVCAVEQGIVGAARPRDDRAVHIRDASSGELAHIVLDREARAPRGDWANYPATVIRRIARNFPVASRGADVAFASNLPRAAGMSSSSALVTAIFLALGAVNRVAESPEYAAAIHSDLQLAAYLGTVENGMAFGALGGESGVGTFGGSEDHAAILCATPDSLTQFAFSPLRAERVVPLPAGCRFAIASSGVVAEKTGAALDAYNRAARRAWEALDALKESSGTAWPTLAAAVDALGLDALAALPPELRSRAEQFALESTIIVPRVADALARGDLAALGVLVDRSQHGAETLLLNQVPETVFLARAARELGAVAASAFGAGFGGSVWALIAEAEVQRFTERWRAAYASRFPEREPAAAFVVTSAGPHARRIELG